MSITIKQIRERLNYSRESFADYLQISVDELIDWEEADKSPDVKYIPTVINLIAKERNTALLNYIINDCLTKLEI